MKIVVIDPWCFTPPYNRELCDGLASIGHEVTLIGQDRGDSDGRQNGSAAGFVTLGLFTSPANGLPRILTLLAKGIRHVQGYLRSLCALRRLRPDVIHVQWLPLPLVDAFFVLLLRRIAPVVLTVHDSNPYNGAGPLLLRLGNMLATRRFDRWIVHNELSERQLVARGLPRERIHRVAHGLLSPPVSTSVEVKKRAAHRVHFLQFGKLKEYKGADVLLKASASLTPTQRDRCRVSIVGRPYLETQPLFDLIARHRLEALVDLKLDFVSDAKMAALFDDADVLVFPYRGIDTSGVLMAAIARGIPVVASNIGCFAEMLADGAEGRLVAPDDPQALAAALIDLIEDPAKVEAMRAGMAALQQRIPSWQRIADSTTEVYELAQAPPTSRPIGAHT
ncbi:MAG: glycosyltransferase family 4 protein [Alphaproteobacteria bacterium]|nr:glycosyltransferase family 4 protein [Alphaproteobacteria bacterium]